MSTLNKYTGANGGSFHTAENWELGHVPTTGEYACANAKTGIVISENITCDEIGTYASGTGAAGGTFVCSTDGLTLTCNVTAGTTVCLTLSHTGTETNAITVEGAATGGSDTAAYGITNATGTLNCTTAIGGTGTSTYGISNASTGIVNCTTAIGGTASYAFGIYNASTGIVNCTTAIGGTGSGYGIYNAATGIVNCTTAIGGTASGYGIYNAALGTVNVPSQTQITTTASSIGNVGTGSINVTGNITGAVSASIAPVIINSAGGTVNVTGSVIADKGAISETLGLIQNTGIGTINVSADVTGGSVANAIAISNTGAGSVVVSGTTTGGSHATNTPAIYNSNAGATIDIIHATTGAYPALTSTVACTAIIIRGNETGANYIRPLVSAAMQIWKCSATLGQNITIQDTTGANQVFSNVVASGNYPAVTDVRFGISYANGDTLTGTCHVPTADLVAKGVDIDNTVGEAILTEAALQESIASLLGATIVAFK
jgi:hypothetical protein